MTKAPFLRRRRAVAFRATHNAGRERGGRLTAWPSALLAVLALLFAFSEVTLYDLAIHPLDSLGHLAWGAENLFVTMVETLPYLLTAIVLWLAGVLTWRLVGAKPGAQP